MPASIPKPPYDPALAAFLSAYPSPPEFTTAHIPALRKAQDDASSLETVLSGNEPFTHSERTVPTPNGSVTLSVFTPKTANGGAAPGIYYMHGGGMICGNRFTGMKDCLVWGKRTGAVCITVEYRLAPDHAYPAPLDDCWAGLRWVGAHLAELGIAKDRLMVAGQSAGGNLAAAVALLARDKGGPALCGQLLDCPMLDDRMEMTSSKQYVGEGTWSRGSGVTSWTSYLGANVGKDGVSPYAAPSRATDLSKLPPAFICVGSAELFRDEAVDYATKIWAAGGQAELHVWPGGFHCFDMLMPDHEMSKKSIEDRASWAEIVLSKKPEAKL